MICVLKTSVLRVYAAGFGFLIGFEMAHAAQIQWDNECVANTSWACPTNWAGDIEPGMSDDAVLSVPSGGTVFVPFDTVVKSVEASIPLSIQAVLEVTANSTLEDSLTTGGTPGRLRASGAAVVTFELDNDIRTTTLDGTGSFQNDGVLTTGTRPIDSFFRNTSFGEVDHTAQIAHWENVLNEGVINLLTNAGLGSASTLINEGTLKKTNDNSSGLSAMSAEYLQQGNGKIFVGQESRLVMNGGVQQYQGGTLEVDGDLFLSDVHTGDTHEFDGLTRIHGGGDVLQVSDFAVLQNLEVDMSLNATNGYSCQADLMFESGAVLENKGRLEFLGSPEITGNGSLNNVGLLFSGASANPFFGVPVSNVSTAHMTGFRLQSNNFVNSGALLLSGSGDSIQFKSGFPTNMPLVNQGGLILYEPFSDSHTHSIQLPVNDDLGRIRVQQGTLRLERGGDMLGTKITAIQTNASIILVEAFPSVFVMQVVGFFGDGFIQLGDSPSAGVIQVPAGQVVLGVNSLSLPQVIGNPGFYMEKGTISILENARVLNLGNMVCRNGSSIVSPLSATNAVFDTGSTMWLDVGLALNLRSRLRIGEEGCLCQWGTLQILDETLVEQAGRLHVSEEGAHCIENGGVSVQGVIRSSNVPPREATYLLDGLLFHAPTNASQTSLIKVDFFNSGEVQVHKGILSLEQPRNLMAPGVLSNGSWQVWEGAQIIFPGGDIHTLRHGAQYAGAGAENITTVGSFDKTETRSRVVYGGGVTGQQNIAVNPSGEAHVSGGFFLAPGKELVVESAGVLTGTTNQLTGQVRLLPDAVFRPGLSPGTFWIDDSLEMSNSLLEIEIAGTASNLFDQVVVTDTTQVSGVVQPILLDGFVPAIGQTFTFFHAGEVTGTFSQVASGGAGDRIGFSIGYTSTSAFLTAQSALYTNYQEWANDTFTPSQITNDTISGFFADADEDGLINGLEYVHGLQPFSSNASPVSWTVDIGNTNNGDLRVTFPWAGGMADIDFSIRGSTNLVDWIPVPHSVIDVTTNGNMLAQELRVDLTTRTNLQFFSLFAVDS